MSEAGRKTLVSDEEGFNVHAKQEVQRCAQCNGVIRRDTDVQSIRSTELDIGTLVSISLTI